jgi:anti-sigma-K factor RskA
MVKKGNREVATMSRKLEIPNIQRYSSSVIVDHLASNYVMGLLSPLVRKRVDTLRAQFDYRDIDQRIDYWEQKLSPLNNSIVELAPLPETWHNIQSQLNMDQQQTHIEQKQTEKAGGLFTWPTFSMLKWSTAFSLVICVVLGYSLLQQNKPLDALSYVAVLQDNNQTPQVVAATYGASKKLVLDILSLPAIDSEQSYELWVTSKTDNQSRSLGEIPRDSNSFNRQLSEAEWRLIADSSFLVISVEDMGGSAIGEPSDTVISKGACIRLSAWEEQT